jgi:alcohol dehydrogenase class IV
MLALKVKTGIASRRLRPSVALVDPACTDTLPGPVVAASGFDQLSHALEAFTARPFTERPRPDDPLLRPISQGANPWSDIGSLEALRLAGRYLVRAVRDAADREAREQILFASTLAGIAFGNAGVHLPHAMAYGVAGLVRDFRMPEYPPEEPMVPHGVSVIVNAPTVFRATACSNPARHLAAATALGADTSHAPLDEAGDILAQTIIGMMQQTGIPNGISAVGYSLDDVEALTAGTIVQKRLLAQAPIAVDHNVVARLFRGGMSYWDAATAGTTRPQ